MAHASPSDFQKIVELEEEQNKIRDILFFQSIHGVSQSNTFGQGRKSTALGSKLGGESWFPLEAAITDIDLNDIATGIFDKLNLQSLTNVIVGPAGTLILKTIQHVADGKIFSITPGTGRTVEITPGDNIEVASTITLTDKDMAFMQFFKDTGKVKVVSRPATSAVPAGTAENDHLEWDNSGMVWVSQQFLEFGAGIHPTVGNLRFKNNTIALAFRNFADDGDIEVKLDTNDFLDITENNNANVTLRLRAQHATEPDQSLTITQNPGAGAVAELATPTELDITIGAVGVGNFVSTGFDINQHDIIGVKDLIGRDAASPAQTFRIIFDANEDSDTFISDSNADPDRINVVNNGVNYWGFLFDSVRGKGLVGLTTGANSILTLSNNPLEIDAQGVPADSLVSNDSGIVFFDTSTDPAVLKIKKKTTGGTASIVSLEGAGSGANTALSNLIATSINQDLIPQASKNLGSLANAWAGVFGAIFTLASGVRLKLTGSDMELETASGQDIIFSEAGTDFLVMDGGANASIFKRDIHLTAAEAIRADSVTEIGYFVSNQSANPGAEGSIELPFMTTASPTDAQLNTAFGNFDGACGISGSTAATPRWQIRVNNNWKQVDMIDSNP